MHVLSLIGGLVGGAVALVLCAGCESQAGVGYQGEPILTLQGSVELGDDPAADQVPVLAFRGRTGFLLLDTRVEGQFPAHFTMTVFDPPPASALTDPNGTVSGVLTVVPKDHPNEVPYLDRGGLGTPNDDGTLTLELDTCTVSNICRHRTLSCAPQEECPLVGETGPVIPADQVTTRGIFGQGNDTHRMDVAEQCNAAHECHRVFLKCDLRSSDLSDIGYTRTCTVISASGDTRVDSYEAVLRAALDYSIVYTSQAVPNAPGGPIEAGYSVFRDAEPDSDQAWIDSINCVRDAPKGTACPVGMHTERVLPNEQLTLRLGNRNR